MRGLRGNLSIRVLFMKDYSSQGTRSGLTCRNVTDRASEYLDDRLFSLTKLLVDLHLASCAHCRAYIRQIDFISSVLRSLPTLDPSPVDHLRLRQQFAARHGSPT
jgi:predicted anti-sigma-YlaC factor YlaD